MVKALPVWRKPCKPFSHDNTATEPFMHKGFSTDIQSHPFGYHELKDKPAKPDLKAYYEQRYYQNSVRTHRPSYSPQELLYRENKCIQKRMLVENIWEQHKPAKPRLLDIGAGEGFVMDHFDRAGYAVRGMDFSNHGCNNHHPQLLDRLDCGDIEELVQQAVESQAEFDLVILDNVLEHLLEPGQLLACVAQLLRPNGVLIIEVPNDFSMVQNHLLAEGRIPRPFWVASPDHISYFNADGLNALLNHHGFAVQTMLADFPIDLFLFNDKTNYVTDATAGKGCHQARIDIENLMHAQNPQATLDMYVAMAKLGVGRQIMGVYQVRDNHQRPSSSGDL
jgi:2-polyprenyl-3-methyl-5-hydroxy-6-metoxy-1,4-benzoquinol methylase